MSLYIVIYANRDEIRIEEFTMGLHLHAKFGSVRGYGVGAGTPKVGNLVKIAVPGSFPVLLSSSLLFPPLPFPFLPFRLLSFPVLSNPPLPFPFFPPFFAPFPLFPSLPLSSVSCPFPLFSFPFPSFPSPFPFLNFFLSSGVVYASCVVVSRPTVWLTGEA